MGRGRPDPLRPNAGTVRRPGYKERWETQRNQPPLMATGRSPYDPVSVVGSAAAQAKRETLAYTRLTSLFINATYYVTGFCFLHSDRVALR